MAKIKHPLIHQFSLLRIMLLKIKLLRAQKRHVSSVCQTNMLKKMGAILAFMVLWELVFYFGKAQGHTQAVSGIALPSRSDKLFFQVDGIILAWKGSTENPNPFELSLSLEGHTAAVICLTVGEKRLYSGSMDNTVSRDSLLPPPSRHSNLSSSLPQEDILFWVNLPFYLAGCLSILCNFNYS
ncbi:uncharacterized protein LOC110637041 isoform X5 [Hevea brasiliensis]|uniref:uncharacterized protein LOC110637041 isoform X5 n=1 Tax=Hevea brasiliensis TaxID=3981 RepID=UPI0025D680D7|nr:uncharacterized protein LOC110637041 isoform X5 [Hevea brasiliensis]